MECCDFSADFCRFVVTISQLYLDVGKLIIYSMLSFYNFTIFIGRVVKMLSFADYLLVSEVCRVHLRLNLMGQANINIIVFSVRISSWRYNLR